MKLIKKIKKLLNKTFIKYGISSGICMIIDLSFFTLFTYIFKNKISSYIFISTLLARIISSLINSIINRSIVFKSNENKYLSTLKYFILVGVQLCVSAFLVNKLYLIININETIIKFFVDVFIFICNYFIQKKFIFKR